MIVDSIEVLTSSPPSISIVGALARRLHSTSRPTTIRHLIGFELGDAIDTLRLAESLRTLQETPLLSAVTLDVRECRTASRATLVFRTTDAWTARGGVRFSGVRSAATIGEDNLFGTGRSIRASLRMDEGQPGFGLRYVDPWFLGAPLALSASRNVYRGGN
ncbi:MAG: hypothetical protein ABIT38_08085, partial [Gemmatimonadaceae bacterium]